MIIDFHTHIFPDKIAAAVIDKLSKISRTMPFTDGTISGLLNSMQKSGIALSIILPVATNAEQVIKINDSAARINEKFAGGEIFSFGCIHPEFSDFRAELRRIKELGLKGVKIHPVYQGANIDDIKFLRISDRIAELDLILVTHAGLDIGFPNLVRCSPKMILNVVKKIGDFKFVAAHAGGWRNWNEAGEYLADTNIFIDTAFSTGKIYPLAGTNWKAEDLKLLTAEEFLNLVKIFGSERIIFGTDSPWSSQKESAEFIKNLPLSENERKNILGLNGAKLLDICR